MISLLILELGHHFTNIVPQSYDSIFQSLNSPDPFDHSLLSQEILHSSILTKSPFCVMTYLITTAFLFLHSRATRPACSQDPEVHPTKVHKFPNAPRPVYRPAARHLIDPTDEVLIWVTARFQESCLRGRILDEPRVSAKQAIFFPVCNRRVVQVDPSAICMQAVGLT